MHRQVHQGDEDGAKGVYHINAVDCVTQWEIVATCFEAYLLPGDRAALEGFPFTISGFYADNGSEYVNHQVAGLLEKPHIELTSLQRPVQGDATHASKTNVQC